MRFCKDCNNMLYSRENASNQLLDFFCKNCGYSESVEENSEDTNCIYKNEIKSGQSSIKIDPSIVNDPTYSRTNQVQCVDCSHREAIFFQNPNLNDSGMKLVFVCCAKRNGKYCGKWWYN